MYIKDIIKICNNYNWKQIGIDFDMSLYLSDLQSIDFQTRKNAFDFLYFEFIEKRDFFYRVYLIPFIVNLLYARDVKVKDLIYELIISLLVDNYNTTENIKVKYTENYFIPYTECLYAVNAYTTLRAYISSHLNLFFDDILYGKIDNKQVIVDLVLHFDEYANILIPFLKQAVNIFSDENDKNFINEKIKYLVKLETARVF